jgi:hypothetical protein
MRCHARGTPALYPYHGQRSPGHTLYRRDEGNIGTGCVPLGRFGPRCDASNGHNVFHISTVAPRHWIPAFAGMTKRRVGDGSKPPELAIQSGADLSTPPSPPIAQAKRPEPRRGPRRGNLCFGRVCQVIGAVEKTRTSTAFRPQRPQRCASTNSATTAHRIRGKAVGQSTRRGRSGPLAKGPAGCNRDSGSHPFFCTYSGFQPISANLAVLGTSVTASLIVSLSPGLSTSLGGTTFQV